MYFKIAYQNKYKNAGIFITPTIKEICKINVKQCQTQSLVTYFENNFYISI